MFSSFTLAFSSFICSAPTTKWSRRDDASRNVVKLDSMPRIQRHEIKSLTTNGYVVIPDFISSDLQQALRDDVFELRSQDKFSAAKVGSNQSTNQLNTELRVTETCVLGSALKESNAARSYLYEILKYMRLDLNDNVFQKLDAHGGELLYLYYKKGGFYKRHVDAMPDSKSFQRCFSILLYLNSEDWTKENAGQLRLYWYALCVYSSTLNHLLLLLFINIIATTMKLKWMWNRLEERLSCFSQIWFHTKSWTLRANELLSLDGIIIKTSKCSNQCNLFCSLFILCSRLSILLRPHSNLFLLG